MRIHALSKILLALCFALLASVALVGCGSNEPDVDVKALAEAVGHGDAAAAKEFKLTEKQASSVGAKFVEGLGKSIGAKKEATDVFQKAMDDKLKTLQYKTEVLSKTEDSAKVKVTTDYISFLGAFAGAMQGIEAEASKFDKNDPTAMEKVGNSFMNLFAKEITNAKVEGQQTFEVEVKKNKDTGKWIPADVEKFQEDLARYMLFKDGDNSILSDMK